MSQRSSRISRFLRELKRRKIYRVAVTYGAVGLALAEGASHVFDALLFPPWAHRLFVVMVIFGFPVALVLAWAFEVTPDGVRRAATAAGPDTHGGDRPEGRASQEGGRDRGPEEAAGVFARHGRTLAFGIAAGLITVVAIGLWTAGDQAESPPPEGDRVVQVDSAAAGEPVEGDLASPDGTGSAPGEATRESSEPDAGAGEGATTRRSAGQPADGRRSVNREEAETSDGSARTGRASAEASATRSPESRPGSSQPGADPPAEETTYRGVAILIDGDGNPGYRTTEGVILEQLAAEGIQVLDRTSLELQRALSGDGSSRPEELGRRLGARAVVMGSYRSAASASVGGFYTGTATLSVRTYDTRSGRLLGSTTFRVGGTDSPGKMANTPDAAATEAGQQVGYQAARALARELEDVLADGDGPGDSQGG